MAACFCCLRCCWEGTNFSSGHVQLKELPVVKLDIAKIGHDVVIVKNGKRICGTGAALATAPIAQNKGYFEIKLQCTGTWGVGLATGNCDLNRIPLGKNSESWVLREDGTLYHENQEKGKLTVTINEGDVLGISYDHVEMNFFLNGQPVTAPFHNIRGEVFPVFYVDGGAVIDVQFTKFYHPPPSGFEEIMIEQSLL